MSVRYKFRLLSVMARFEEWRTHVSSALLIRNSPINVKRALKVEQSERAKGQGSKAKHIQGLLEGHCLPETGPLAL